MENKGYNILFLTKWYPNKFDRQLGVFVRKHAKAVSGYCNVTVLYACADNGLKTVYETTISQEQSFKEIIVYYKQNRSALKFFINAYRYIKANNIGIRETQKNSGTIDLIHVNVLNRPGLIALMLKKTKGIPYIITEHWTGYVSGAYKKSSLLKKLLTKYIIKNADALTTVSNSLRKKMLSLGLNNNYTVVPNVVENILPSPPANNAKVKILSIADLVDSHKNISGIITEIASVSKQNPNIEYHIIGDGPDR